MQVRYQAAPRPDTLEKDCAILGSARGAQSYAVRAVVCTCECVMRRTAQRANRTPLPPQELQHFLKLETHLPHDLLALTYVRARFFARQLLTRAADGETLFV